MQSREQVCPVLGLGCAGFGRQVVLVLACAGWASFPAGLSMIQVLSTQHTGMDIAASDCNGPKRCCNARHGHMR